MPLPLAWTLISPLPARGGAQPESTSTAAPFLPCSIEAFTQQDLLDLFERLLPQHYLAPLKETGPGYEVLQAAAAMGARLSQAVARYACGAFILSSTGGAKATGSIEFYRPTPNAEGIPVTILAGTVVKSSKGGRRYVTTANAVFAPSDLGPFTVPVEALLQGYNYNEPGIVVTADGTSLEGEIDTIVTLVEDPPVGDVTFRVRHPIATTGGVDPALDQHGIDRLIFRGVSETDDTYRGRVRALPDNISPNAVDRALQQLLLPYNLSYDFIETFELGYVTCWDGPADSIPGSPYDPDLLCYDDPRSPSPFRARWLDESEMRGAFIVVVPAFGPLTDYGVAYDDTAVNATQLSNPYGSRAVGAWDAELVYELGPYANALARTTASVITADIGKYAVQLDDGTVWRLTSIVPTWSQNFTTESFGYLLGCWDGYDVARATVMKTLYDTLQNIKAAGTAAVVELEGQ
jgi:hypothetical protein